jgi:RsmE family RNA methyltransferase
MNLIILDDRDRTGDDRYELRDGRAEHIRTILKLGVGDTVEAGVVDGPLGVARIEAIDVDSVTLVCENMAELPMSRPDIRLICALPRPQTLKKILITSAMMGVRSLDLVRANRVEKSYFQSPLIEPENQYPYLVEGLAQGKLTRLPEVRVHDRFRPFFEDEQSPLAKWHEPSAARLVCSTEGGVTLDKVCDIKADAMVIAIGPEGGWVPFELELMQSLGFRPFRLGRWVLRVEHAVTAALAQLELLRTLNR